MTRSARNRKNHRLKRYDYAKTGFYYVTICTYKHKPLFGEMSAGPGRTIYVINEYRNIVREEWEETGLLRKYICLDRYVIMPNHFHGIIIIDRKGMTRHAPTREFGKPLAGTLATIISSFKAAVTKQINSIRKIKEPVWQRSFYDRVIRNDKELNQIREYIQNNPTSWIYDKKNVGP